MAKALEFPHARIAAVSAKFPEDGKLETCVELHVELTQELANLLRCGYLYVSNGFEHRVSFDLELKSVRVAMSPHGEVAGRILQFDSPLISAFKAVKNGATVIEFKAESQSSITTVLDYILNVGGALGVLRLEPLQGELFEGLPVEQPPKEKQKPLMAKGSKRVQ
jgi:hypothetical protein